VILKFLILLDERMKGLMKTSSFSHPVTIKLTMRHSDKEEKRGEV